LLLPLLLALLLLMPLANNIQVVYSSCHETRIRIHYIQ
jgi:hypothetical protein